MAHTQAWSKTIPASGDPVGQGDDEIRDLRRDVEERLLYGGTVMDDSDTTDGRMAVDAGGSGVSPIVYKSDMVTPLITPTDTGVAFAEAITGPGVSSGDDPGHLHTGVIIFNVPLTLTAGRLKPLIFEAPRALTVLEIKMVLGTLPTTTDCVITAWKLAAPILDTTDRYAAGTALFTAPNRPTCTPTEYANASTTFVATTDDLAAGDQLTFEVITASAAADLSILVKVK